MIVKVYILSELFSSGNCSGCTKFHNNVPVDSGSSIKFEKKFE